MINIETRIHFNTIPSYFGFFYSWVISSVFIISFFSVLYSHSVCVKKGILNTVMLACHLICVFLKHSASIPLQKNTLFKLKYKLSLDVFGGSMKFSSKQPGGSVNVVGSKNKALQTNTFLFSWLETRTEVKKKGIEWELLVEKKFYQVFFS